MKYTPDDIVYIYAIKDDKVKIRRGTVISILPGNQYDFEAVVVDIEDVITNLHVFHEEQVFESKEKAQQASALELLTIQAQELGDYE